LNRRLTVVPCWLAGVWSLPPATAATAVTNSGKRVYYASDVGIIPKAVLPVDSTDAQGLKYAVGKNSKPDVQAVGSPGIAAVDQSDEINAFLQDIRAEGGGVAIFGGDAERLVGYRVGNPIVMIPEVAIWGRCRPRLSCSTARTARRSSTIQVATSSISGTCGSTATAGDSILAPSATKEPTLGSRFQSTRRIRTIGSTTPMAS
jgi:hypothetical protein